MKIYWAILFMSCFVCIRSVILIILSFIPPIAIKKREKSKLYPDGATYWDFFLENEVLTLVYTLNVVYCFFSLVYCCSCYYSWIIAQLHLAHIEQDKKAAAIT